MRGVRFNKPDPARNPSGQVAPTMHARPDRPEIGQAADAVGEDLILHTKLVGEVFDRQLAGFAKVSEPS